jgi:hypothetical protein
MGREARGMYRSITWLLGRSADNTPDSRSSSCTADSMVDEMEKTGEWDEMPIIGEAFCCLVDSRFSESDF